MSPDVVTRIVPLVFKQPGDGSLSTDPTYVNAATARADTAVSAVAVDSASPGPTGRNSVRPSSTTPISAKGDEALGLRARPVRLQQRHGTDCHPDAGEQRDKDQGKVKPPFIVRLRRLGGRLRRL